MVKKQILAAAIAVPFLCSSCTTIDESSAAPSDWVDLIIVEHKVSLSTAIGHCYYTVPLGLKILGGVAIACAELNFIKLRCDIWYTFSANLEHEYEHCRGRDHGDNTIADAWKAYQSVTWRWE